MCNIQDEVFHKVGPDDLHTYGEELLRKTTADTDTWQPGDARRFQQRVGNLAEQQMVFTRSSRQRRRRACWSDYHVNFLECSGNLSLFQGLRLAPKSDVSVEDPCANASILVFPRLTAPASVIRRTTVASYGGTKFLKTLLEAVVLTPLVQKLSLIEMGIPSKGRTSPLPNKRSALRACSKACASVRVTNARSFGSTALILSRHAPVSSREENLFSWRPLLASATVSSYSSIAIPQEWRSRRYIRCVSPARSPQQPPGEVKLIRYHRASHW